MRASSTRLSFLMKIRKPFYFKNFKLEQELVTLPVTTDACLFGAYCEFDSPKRILDIGTGTGLLAFMMHQKYSDATIIGIEKHPETAQQAKSNVNLNRFPNIEIIESDFFHFSEHEKFDGIISNPPFFSNQLESETEIKNQARHLQDHTFSEFYCKIATVLSDNGNAQILLPFTNIERIENDLKESNLKIQSFSTIRANSSKKPHLIAINLGFQTKEQLEIQHDIVLKTADNKLTAQAYNLLSPFYLDQALNL